jgi:molecular chaperone DnaJ
MFMDLYLALGVRHGASAGEIKRAYRRLARRFHPELNPGNDEAALRFRQIVDAYETLVDPDRRRQYDTGAAEPASPATSSPAAAAAFAFEGFDFTALAEGASASTFGDLFADVMRAAAESAIDAGGRGADLHADVRAPFEAVVQGAVAHVTVTRLAPCADCRGTARIATAERPCPACLGTGTLRGARGHMVFARSCPRCDGAGAQRFVGCPSCRGEGVSMRSEAVAVKVPAGVHDGERLRVAGQGNAGRRGGGAGDLYVTVHVAPHPRFRREGDDLHLDVPLAIHEAAFGTRIDVESPTGPCRLRIPPGTNSGRQFRVRERGLPSARGGPAGDLVATVRLVLPPLDDERSRALVRELAMSYRDNVRRDSNG